MEQTFRLVVGMALPVVVIVGYYGWRVHVRKQRLERSPVSEKLLRPPGEYLRLKIEELDSEILTWMSMAIWSSGVGLMNNAGHWWASLVAVVLCVGVMLAVLITKVRERRDRALGFSGERYVAEELTPLIAGGCQVFHDFPQEVLGNIDHIVVAPAGVFTIETKARRKKKMPKGEEDHRVTFDGRGMRFPDGYVDTAAIAQARRNAEWLSQWLTKATGEPVTVTPILAYPGWFVELKAKSDFPIVNPRAIKNLIPSYSTTLDAKQRQRIAFQIEQKVRDVEF